MCQFRKDRNFKNVNGKTLNLFVLQKKLSLIVSIRNTDYYLYQKCMIFLLLLLTLNVLFYILHLVSGQITVIAGSITIFAGLHFCQTIKEDNLLIINGLGIQLTSAYFLKTKTMFIPLDRVQNIFINEVLLKRRIIYLLTLIVKEKDTKELLIPLFMETLPRLSCLKLIYSMIVNSYLRNSHITEEFFEKL